MPPAFKIWVASLLVLTVKMHLNSAFQKRGRDALGTYPRPEDAARHGVEHREDTGLAWRAGRCWQNDIENIPLYLLVSLAYVLAGGPEGWAYLLFGVYTAARILHTVFYLRALQPWRFVSYVTGQVTVLAIMGVVVHRTFIA